MIQYYNVADFLFSIEAEEPHFECLTNYAPFRQSTNDPQPATLFAIRLQDGPLPSKEGWKHIYTDMSDDDMPRIEMYSHEGEWMFLV